MKLSRLEGFLLVTVWSATIFVSLWVWEMQLAASDPQ